MPFRENIMSLAKCITTLALGVLPVFAIAEPLVAHTTTTGQVTAVNNSPYEIGAPQPGTPITVRFDAEYNTSYPTVTPGTFTVTDWMFFRFGITAGSTTLDLQVPPYSDWRTQNAITLRDNVRNAAGDLVDVFELTAGAHPQFPNVTYTLSTHLEYAPTTFNSLNQWSILAVEDAPLLRGTIQLDRDAEGWDGTWVFGNLRATVSGFDAQFAGPGAEVPCVPEPGQAALLLIGLLGAALMRALARQRGHAGAQFLPCA